MSKNSLVSTLTAVVLASIVYCSIRNSIVRNRVERIGNRRLAEIAKLMKKDPESLANIALVKEDVAVRNILFRANFTNDIDQLRSMLAALRAV